MGARRALPPQLSVVIPTLNEAAALPALLDDLRAQRRLRLQVIVADGGSTDATGTLARAGGAEWLEAPRGRGAQMNAGRAAARAPMLLFLHADSRLEYPQQLAEAARLLQAGQRVAGHFALRFERRQGGRERLYRYMEGKTRLQRPGTINGDQGLLIHAAWFDQLGGFDQSLPYFEDQRIAARIFQQGRWLLLPGRLQTSARRFETEGPYRRYALMGLMMAMHAAQAEDFFARAAGVYRSQDQARALALRPYLKLAAQSLRAAGAPALLRLARYGLANAWQLAYLADQLGTADELPLLRRYQALERRLGL